MAHTDRPSAVPDAGARVAPTSNGQAHPAPRTQTLLGIRILGTGCYLPEQVISNRDLHASHGFDPDWIVNRTGIQERRFALPHQATSDLCTQAALRCLRAAGREPGDVDLLVLGTFTPDMAFPSTANLVQDQLKLACPAFDVQAACAGFVYALIIAAQFVGTGNSRCALVIGGDCNSRIINPGDQKSYPLFGDGAGAVLLAPGEPDQGLLAYQLGSDGSGGDLLSRPACGSRIPPSAAALEQGLHYLTMDGRAIFKWAVRILADSTLTVLAHAHCQVRDVRWFIPHQANVRIIHAATDVLGFHRDSVFKNLDRYGNTSAGSIPIALDELNRQGSIQREDLLLISGFGAGLNWGTALWRW
ncbi:MAG TPA: beta-ketoacyl-ACP synthase III [Isosphaeraceae bacterium]|nr:beta-ketoacyl-ACP synthase III [Isosphaeraceae bacterium]